MKLNDTLQERINALCRELGSAVIQIEALQARAEAIKSEIKQISSLAPQLEHAEKNLWKHIEGIVKASSNKSTSNGQTTP